MIIVTTPTGNVGSEVVRLLQEHVPVLPFRVAAHTPEKILQLYGEKVSSARLDFDDAATWTGALEGVSILFLVCPQPDPQTIRTQMLPFIDTAVQAGCQHIIYQSVPGADHVKILPHYQIERHIEKSGISFTFLRPSYFMQNFLRKASTHGVDIATRQEIFIPAGKGRISLVDARDVAAVVVKICEDPSAYKDQGYYLTGSEALNMGEIASIFSQVFKEPVRNANPSLPRFWYRLRKRRVPWSLVFIMSVEYTLARLGKSHHLSDNVATFLGRSPRMLTQFITDNRQCWITQTWV
jgi:uncharacterized protein YbjT (DUF2867 family)